jgi:hypothetical protein
LIDGGSHVHRTVLGALVDSSDSHSFFHSSEVSEGMKTLLAPRPPPTILWFFMKVGVKGVYEWVYSTLDTSPKEMVMARGLSTL